MGEQSRLGLDLAGADAADHLDGALIAMLRGARGVGLRVLARTASACRSCEVANAATSTSDASSTSIRRVSLTAHSYGPRADAQLLARRGPTFISVDDTRPGSRRRIVIDRSTPEANVLEAVDWRREITTMERACIHSLTLDGLAFSSGDCCVGLPVCQGIWCV
ncbi:hypothetical protein [Streptomyces europaeiscabiei]|uniref:hypothetical protein n=1 Tax=Streptomyces europaeiscabiei TaxID=146819 RepID=UPI0038F5DA09